MENVETREVFNQPMQLAGYDFFDTSRPPRHALNSDVPAPQAAPPAMAHTFRASRLAGDRGHALDTLAIGTDLDSILQRAQPR